MNKFHRRFTSHINLMPVLLASILTACGGGSGRDPVLGGAGTDDVGASATSTPPLNGAPSVASTLPLASTPAVTGVATSSRVSATFNKLMDSATLTAPNTFTVACPAGTPVSATVAYDSATQVMSLTPAQALPAGTLCVATITTAAKDTLGLALASTYVWRFTTATPADNKTRPVVTLTVPGALDLNVPASRRITATFSKDMDPATIPASFTLVNTSLGGAAVAGTVTYSPSARTASFAPSNPTTLAGNSHFTATISDAAKDLAGNALAGNTAVLPGSGKHVWTFITAAAGDITAPSVVTISPVDSAPGVCTTKLVSATFSEPMDDATIDVTTFRVSSNSVNVAGRVSYDAATQLASFVPTAASGFAVSTAYVVTLASGINGVKDLAGNALASDRSWGFVTGSQACRSTVDLRSAASFAAFGGGAGVTNQGVNTVVHGDLGTTAACTLVTGFHDAAHVYTETPLNTGAVNGSINCAPPTPGTATSMSMATQARADAQSAYDQLAALPAGSDPAAGQLGGLVLPASVYTSAGGTFAITTGDLTLDAQGDANAVWVFQSASALTVGLTATPRKVLLVNGAQAKNVFWKVGSAARIEAGSTMVGTIIAPAGVTISTNGQTMQTTLIGRAIGLTASVTMVNTTVIAP